MRDAVDEADGETPFDKRRLVLEQEFAQVLKVLSREGNTGDTEDNNDAPQITPPTRRSRISE